MKSLFDCQFESWQIIIIFLVDQILFEDFDGFVTKKKPFHKKRGREDGWLFLILLGIRSFISLDSE